MTPSEFCCQEVRRVFVQDAWDKAQKRAGRQRPVLEGYATLLDGTRISAAIVLNDTEARRLDDLAKEAMSRALGLMGAPIRMTVDGEVVTVGGPLAVSPPPPTDTDSYTVDGEPPAPEAPAGEPSWADLERITTAGWRE